MQLNECKFHVNLHAFIWCQINDQVYGSIRNVPCDLLESNNFHYNNFRRIDAVVALESGLPFPLSSHVCLPRLKCLNVVIRGLME